MKYVVFDIDGVLARPNPERMRLIGALPGDRTDWAAFYRTDFSKDEPIEAGRTLIRLLFHRDIDDVVFLTSRSEKVRDETERWLNLNLNLLGRERLLMRPDWDGRRASVVKVGLLRRAFTPANVFCVVDDELENANAFAAAGYTSLLFKEGKV